MTNTQSRISAELDELGPWDDAGALENDDGQGLDADARELVAYAFDSDNRTLVGLGPVERARRSRRAAEVPDGDRMPHSEPPGPFIADDDDEELKRALRGPRLGPWAAAVPAALAVTAVAVALVRGLTPQAPAANKLAVAAAAQVTPSVAQKLDTASGSEPAPAPAPAPEAAEEAPAEANAANDRHEIQNAPARVEAAPHAALATGSVAAPVLPVKLPELPPPAVVDMSDGTSKGVGTLNVSSSPPANVVLDGRPLGQAPRLVQVPVGIHTVVFIHPLYGRQSRSVKVSAGRMSSASADF